MRMVAKTEDLSIDDDPRPRDRVIHNRLKLMVRHKACHQAWGCVLYSLHDLGRIDNDQREAGDKYWTVVNNFRRTQATDPDELVPEARELAYRRIHKAKKIYWEAISILGIGRKYVDSVVLEDEWPVSERHHLVLRDGLRLLANFFSTGRTKGVRNVV